MKLGSGREIKRKEDNGNKVEWKLEEGRLRLQMLPVSYLDLEDLASLLVNGKKKEIKGEKQNGHGLADGWVHGVAAASSAGPNFEVTLMVSSPIHPR